MKKLISLLLAMLLVLSVLPAPYLAAAEYSNREEAFPAASSESGNPPTASGTPEAGQAAASLMDSRSVVRTVHCRRTVNIYGSSSTWIWLYDTATADSHGSDYYHDNYTIWVNGFVLLSDNTKRYFFDAPNANDVVRTYYLPQSNLTGESTIYHTLFTAEEHPH